MSNENLCIVIERFSIIQNNKVLYSDIGFNIEDSEWGKAPMTETCIIESLSDLIINLCWYSATERKRYEGVINIGVTPANIEKICLGISKEGLVAIWNCRENRNLLLMYSTLNDNPIDLDSTTSWNPYVTYKEYTNNYIDGVNKCIEDNFSKESMRQYVYRYLVKQSHNNKEEKTIDSDITDALIKDKCIDGSFDFSYSGNLKKYHKSGVVNKTIVSWKEGKSSYTLCCFFEENASRKFFSRYYGAHNETKTDLIFLLDTKNNKYKIYLYRYGTVEPLEFPNIGYKIIVFKSGFEKYRSENYNMPRGAWAW